MTRCLSVLGFVVLTVASAALIAQSRPSESSPDAGIRQKIDDHMRSRYAEKVVAGLAKVLPALPRRGHQNWLDGLYSERLNDRLHRSVLDYMIPLSPMPTR